MLKIETFRRAGSPGCAELGEAGLVDISACCETRHSAEGHVGTVLGPYRVTPTGGEVAFVCCAGRKQLLRARSRDPKPVGDDPGSSDGTRREGDGV